MPYKVIKGTFHLTGLTKSGNPTSFQPDGDSLQFKPDNPAHLDDLERVAYTYKLTNINSVNLRFEGIDATEMHYGGSRQPSPLAENSRYYVTGRYGMNPVNYRKDGYRVLPPANDGQSGYILSKQLGFYGRPIAFVFVGNTSRPDGSSQHLDSAWLRQSINYKLISQGLVYPLFYDTLYNDLRETMRDAAIAAIAQATIDPDDDSVWSFDWTNYWVDVADEVGVQEQFTIYPKVFRRITDFHNEYAGFDHDTFKQWLEAKSENDMVWVRPEWNRTHLDNIIDVQGSRIRLNRYPEDLVFVSST